MKGVDLLAINFVKGRISHELIVCALTVILFIGFSLTLNGFFETKNLLTLLRSVSVLGILSIGMAIVVISRGIDLSLVAVLAICTGFAIVVSQPGFIPGLDQGMPFWLGAVLALLLALGVGAITGILVIYAEIPAIFTTLAMGSVIYGFGRTYFLPSDANYLPADAGWVEFLGGGQLLGLPVPVLMFASVALLVSYVLHRTAFGIFIYAIGDNPIAARSAGLPVRPVSVAIFMLAAVVAYLAGLMTAGAVNNINTRVFNSTLIYDVLLVVVVGGIGLSGGKGGMKNVVIGTLLIGTLLNGMIILNVSYIQQNLIKGIVLLLALLADTILNPRDEQTGQQGDI